MGKLVGDIEPLGLRERKKARLRQEISYGSSIIPQARVREDGIDEYRAVA